MAPIARKYLPRVLAHGLTLAVLAALAAAQHPGPREIRASSQPYHLAPLTFHAQVSSVPVDAVVRDSNGLPVPGLTRANFRITVDGRPVPLVSFRLETAAAPALTPGARPGHLPASAPPSASAAPRHRFIALYFDDVNTSEGALGHARNAATRFVREALGPNDSAAVVTGSGIEEQGFTSNHAQLLAAIAALRAHPRAVQRVTSGCLRISPYQAYLIVNHLDPAAMAAAMANQAQCQQQIGVFTDSTTADYTQAIPGGDSASQTVIATADSVWNQTRGASLDTLHAIEAAVAMVGREPGDRELLLASGGFFGGTMEQSQGDTIQDALREHVTIDALDARGLYTEGPGIRLDESAELVKVPVAMYEFQESSKMSQQLEREAPLANLAQSTGGLFFHNNNDLTLGFMRLGLTPKITYALSFSPLALPSDGKFHHLKVEVAPDHHYTVQSRRGYFDPSPPSPAATLEQTLATAMQSRGSSHGVAANVKLTATAHGVAVDVHFDAGRLPFASQGARRREFLVLIAGLFTPGGRYVTGQRGTLDLALDSATYKRLRARGLGATLRLAAAPGAYRVRVALGEAIGGTLSAFSQSVTVHE